MNEVIFLSGPLLVQGSNVLRSPDTATVSRGNNVLMTGSATGLCKNILFCTYFCSRFSVGLQIELWVGSMGRAELRPRFNSGILKEVLLLFYDSASYTSLLSSDTLKSKYNENCCCKHILVSTFLAENIVKRNISTMKKIKSIFDQIKTWKSKVILTM